MEELNNEEFLEFMRVGRWPHDEEGCVRVIDWEEGGVICYHYEKVEDRTLLRRSGRTGNRGLHTNNGSDSL